MNKIEKALLVAKVAHFGQIDKNGDDYINHPIRVSNLVESETEKIVAILHDVIEDTNLNYEFIETEFDSEIADAVFALTRQPKENYFEFVKRAARNRISKRVKFADIADNLNPDRLNMLDEKKTKKRLIEKYTKAKELLCQPN